MPNSLLKNDFKKTASKAANKRNIPKNIRSLIFGLTNVASVLAGKNEVTPEIVQYAAQSLCDKENSSEKDITAAESILLGLFLDD